MLFVLQQLQERKFEGSPKVLGTDDKGRIILTFIEGDVAQHPYPSWVLSDGLLISVARLLRHFHDALAGLQIPPGMPWPRQPSPEFGGNQICHMDVSLANVVCRAGEAVALIDFEEVGLAQRVWDVARTVRHWVPLIDPDDLEVERRLLATRIGERLAVFVEAYGLEGSERAVLIDAILSNADASFARMREMAALGHPGYSQEWKGHAAERNRRGRKWVEKNRHALQKLFFHNRAVID